MRETRHWLEQLEGDEQLDRPARAAPGKVSLTQRLQPSRESRAAPPLAHPLATPVQLRAERGPVDDPFALHQVAGDGVAASAAAERGFAGSGGALPHLDTIQHAFGHHDVSGVRAHVGGPAAEASAALGARAYASGDQIGFAREPDLFLAAHEAAHVVQQRGGVQLAGGVGRDDDEYERHADQVAAAVVAGQPAAPLLDRYAGRTGGRPAVQRFREGQTPEEREAEARGVLRALRALDEEARRARIAGWSASYTRELQAAISAADRQEFGDVVAAIGGARRASPEIWQRFVTRFQSHFPEDVEHTFPQIDAETFEQLFSVEQRDKLLEYFGNRHLPERLFNLGGGHLSVGQRRLMSAHMLTVGTFTRPAMEQQRQQAVADRQRGGGDDAETEQVPAGEQQVHARMCGHWVSLVNAYAGAASSLRAGARDHFDHDGHVVLNADAERQTATVPERGTTFIPMSRFDELFNAGDWLYIRTSAPVHSVIFSEFIDETPQEREHPWKYRRAITYDQGSPERGGARHTYKLGEVYDTEHGVTMVTRHDPGGEHAEAATSPELLIPQTAGEDGERHGTRAAATANADFLWERHLTEEQALAHVRRENTRMIHELADSRTASGARRLDSSQKEVLARTNQESHLETVVRLNERLQILARATVAMDEGDGDRQLNTPAPPEERPGRRRRRAEAPPEPYETTQLGVDQPDAPRRLTPEERARGVEPEPDRREFDRGQGGFTTGRLSNVQAPFGPPVPPTEREGPQPSRQRAARGGRRRGH